MDVIEAVSKSAGILIKLSEKMSDRGIIPLITELQSHFFTIQQELVNLREINANLALDKRNLDSEMAKVKESHLKEIAELNAKFAEQVRVFKGIEFRNGIKTGNKWAIFCPKCHVPISHRDGELAVICSDKKCGWSIKISGMMSELTSEFKNSLT